MAQAYGDGMNCSVDTCGKLAHARGWCKEHYNKWWRTGDPLGRQKKYVGQPCAVDGCEAPAVSRDWCRKHYNRWHRKGSPHIVAKTLPGAPMEWLLDAIKQPESACVVWPFQKTAFGHGRIRIGKTSRPVAQLVLEITGREMPAGKPLALHDPDVCNNPSCVNPNHLRWGDAAENQADRAIAGTICAGEKAYNAKFTWADIEAMRKDNRILREVAEDYGTSISHVHRIKAGLVWKDENRIL